MIKEMSKVQIIGPKAVLDDCIRALHETSVVHIEPVPFEQAADAFFQRLPMEKDKLGAREFLEGAAERIKNLMFVLKPAHAQRPVVIQQGRIPGYMDELSPVEERVKNLRVTIESLGDELASILKYERLIIGFAPVVSRLGGLKNLEIAGLTIEKSREYVVALLDTEIKRITGGRYGIHVVQVDTATVGIVLTYPREFDSQVRYLISGKSINEIKLPSDYADLTLLNALKLMDKKKAQLPDLIAEAEAELKSISASWYDTVAALKNAVDDALDEIGLLTYAGQTRFAFVIQGWAPSEKMAELRGSFNKTFGDAVLIRELPIDEAEKEHIPVYIYNHRALRPFEVFLRALPPPRYGSIDPTPYVALFFPVFFGLMVGDMGYGAVIFAVSMLLKRRFADKAVLKDISIVLAVSSVSAVIFGFLYGEFFGDLGERLHLLHPIFFERATALKTMMALTVGLGAGHVMLGVLIGAINHFGRGRHREGGARLSYLSAIVSFIFVLAVVLKVLPKSYLTAGVAALVVSLVFLVVLEGALGPLEMIKAVGNMLSYIRIMAVGTASVVMALVANKIGGLSDSVVVGIVVAGLIHSLNIILSMVSPVIQSMRLQYVEFFSKFYEAGGRRYEPFKKR